MMMEWAVAAILDPRQKSLGKFKLVWANRNNAISLVKVRQKWSTHDAFVREVKDAVVEYATGLVDPAVRATWEVAS